MCCVLQGAERVFPSAANGGKHGTGTGSGKGTGGTPVGSQDLPLESLWAAGLDEGMGFPQRCSYANHHTTLVANPDELWRERNMPHRYMLIKKFIEHSKTFMINGLYEGKKKTKRAGEL